MTTTRSRHKSASISTYSNLEPSFRLATVTASQFNIERSGDGYPSKTGKESASKIVAENSDAFAVLEHVIETFRSYAKSCTVPDQDSEKSRRKIIALILASRMLEISEAMTVLMRCGMSNDANTLFRVFLDAYFVFGNVCATDDFVAEYFQSDAVHRLKLINAARTHSSDLFKSANAGVTDAERDALKAKVKDENIQVKSREYARRIGCEEIYDSMYRILSSTVHTTPRALAVYADENSAGTVTKIKDGPYAGDIPQRLHDLSKFLANALSGLQELFDCLDKATLKSIQSRIDAVPDKSKIPESN